MKVLLDENLPHDLRHMLPGHDVFTVAYMGWAAIANGALLSAAADAEFDVLLTKDTGVAYEQHLAALPVAILILHAKTNKLEDIGPHLPAVLEALARLTPKTVAHVG
jgi:predicted nuclease of predicted toxin-antitoxin system